ncbi:MAG TPA: hypothetical protein P5096_00840 [Patescibacteria group bacterium]|nr:hypothetical protein [Patescibacteria group bacterium]
MKRITEDPIFRAELCRKSFKWFFIVYFADYIEYPIAEFHNELFEIAENEKIKTAVITAFRSSAKSTILTVAYAIWAILGQQNRKFVVLVSQTQEQVRVHFKNIKRALESNTLLKEDLGPFEEDEWNSASIVITKLNARITALSSEQSFRGAIHGHTRPQLILCDDIEDTTSVKTREGRDKIYKWFNSEIMPLGDQNTRTIVFGNLTHEDCLLMRLKKEIESGERSGIYREYPMIDENGKILWPGKYPSEEAIEEERKKMDKFSFAREFMLQIIDDREAVINKEDIHYYAGKIPEPLRNQSWSYVTGIDLAISQKDSADCTAMVTMKIIGEDEKMRIYVLPHPINDRLTFSQILETGVTLSQSLGGRGNNLYCVEEVMLQGYLTQHFKDNNLNAEGVKISGMDKRTRLIMTSDWIRKGIILFPERGAEDLIKQILGFGVEKHDDLVDSFTIAILRTINNPPEEIISLAFCRSSDETDGHGSIPEGYHYSKHTVLRGDDFVTEYRLTPN